MKKRAIATGLPNPGLPFEWAVASRGTLYTAHVPIRADGTVETGAFADQVAVTFANLERSLRAAGGSLQNLVQVLAYLTDPGDVDEFNRLYRDFMKPPYPNRALLVVQALAIPGMKVELVAYADIEA